jgi:KDO2-lipid IV(A) lauroyltransferase
MGPGLDQLASADGRRRFVRFWVVENLSGAFDIFMYYLMKLLVPLDTCSNFGARLSHYVFPRWHKRAEERARQSAAAAAGGERKRARGDLGPQPREPGAADH